MNEEILSRRNVLRGALAVGCGICLPIVFSGCDSKTSATPAAAAPGTDSSATTPKKVTQASVQYQQQPKGDQKCSTCANFIAESKTCKLVEGQINPEGYCVLWTKKA